MRKKKIEGETRESSSVVCGEREGTTKKEKRRKKRTGSRYGNQGKTRRAMLEGFVR